MIGFSGNAGWDSQVFTGNQAGVQVCLAAPASVTPSSAPNGQIIGGFTVSDVGAATVQIFDGQGAATKLKAQITLPAAGGFVAIPLGIRVNQGIWLVVSGGTAAVAVTVVYK